MVVKEKGQEETATTETAAEAAAAVVEGEAAASPEGKGEGEAAAVAAPAAAEEADIIGVSPETLEKLKASPEGMELYRSLNKKATEKYQEIAKQKRFLDTLRKDPQGVVREMARRVGVLPSEEPTPRSEAKVEAVVDSFTKRFGPEVGKALREAADEYFADAMAPLHAESLERNVTAHADAFIRAHPDAAPGSDIAAKMEALIEEFPIEDEKKVPGYLEMIYNAVTSGKSKATVQKEVTERMRASAATVEPVRGVSKPSEKKKGYREGMKLTEVFEDLVE